ncbi:class I SAM-dependent methyltransferase [Brevundimonas sp.]|uniref:class I SAM-dependent DNA methyltransferase n=1 Tax=Brevundimonas sp. TaxID=1871086 RepID=UPI00258283F3|nr:class I SAM-dependent methyltransferase [Brevundimonas sp.]
MKPPAEAIADLYARRARDFDADRTKTLFERSWLDAFLAHVPQGGRVLDLGCGSGEPIARYLVEQGCEIVGVDVSPDLIDLCRGRFPDQAWITADMRGVDLGRTFDGVIAWHSLIHLPPEAQPAMLAVFARHLRPGGVLLFTSGSEQGETIGEWRGEPLYHGSLSLDAYRTGLDDVGLDVRRHVVSDRNCGGATVWLARRRGGKVAE